jgi:transposase-like protein
MSEEKRDDEEVVRGGPGRRSVEDRQHVVLELLAGKASVDQLARRYGVNPEIASIAASTSTARPNRAHERAAC